jgi:23S rRNA (uracil1939-C5)-methyltransferase
VGLSPSRASELELSAKDPTIADGLSQASAKAIVDVVQCPVLVPHLEALLPAVRECLSALSALRQLGHVELVLADNGPLMVLRHTARCRPRQRKTGTLFAISRSFPVPRAAKRDTGTYSREAPWYTSDGLRLVFSPRDFIQVNDGVNQQMVRTALAWLDMQPQDRVLDLFCGMGNFTLPLATRAAHVVGVEGVPALVAKGGKTPPSMVCKCDILP